MRQNYCLKWWRLSFSLQEVFILIDVLMKHCSYLDKPGMPSFFLKFLKSDFNKYFQEKSLLNRQWRGWCRIHAVRIDQFLLNLSAHSYKQHFSCPCSFVEWLDLCCWKRRKPNLGIRAKRCNYTSVLSQPWASKMFASFLAPQSWREPV